MTLLASDKSLNSSFDYPTTPKLTTSQIYEVGASLPKEAADRTERVLEMQPAREVHARY
jgi:hypothetical protein